MTPTAPPAAPVNAPAPTAGIQTAAAMYDPANLKIYPGIDMSRFGMNPFGKPLYRLTFGQRGASGGLSRRQRRLAVGVAPAVPAADRRRRSVDS